MVTILGTPIIPLLSVVFMSILEVFLLCLAGYILAVRGILDKKTQRQLNRLNVNLFTPALLFSKVAFFLSPEKLGQLYIIPILFAVVTLTSMAVAWVLSAIFRLRPSQRSFALAAAMFMNSNSLPIALMQSLVATVPSLEWDEDDDKNSMLGRALTYLVLYSTLGMVVRWSYGVRLLARADSEQVHVVDDEEPDLSTGENSPLLPHTPTITTTTTFHASSSSIRSPHHSGDNFCPPLTRRQTPVFYSFPNSASGSQRTLPSYVPRSDSPPPASELPPPSRLRRFFSAITSFMTPPLCAALLSMVVACIPPLQHALEVHLTPVRGALKAAGACAIPVTLVVLGAYFHSPPVEEPRQEDSEDEADSGNVKRVSSFSSLKKIWRGVFRRDERRLDQANKESRPGETKTVIVAIAARMVLTPLLLIPLIALCKKWELEDMLEDPVFVLSTVLLICSPPALTLAQITQAVSGDAFERLISRTIFWAYCAITPLATIVSVVVGLVLITI